MKIYGNIVYRGSDAPEDLQLSTLHRIVLKLSSADLETQLELDPSVVNKPDWLGRTPLMWAALRNDLPSVRLLISYGAGINIRDRIGGNALIQSIAHDAYSCMEALLKAGADTRACDVYGNTPLHYIDGTIDVAPWSTEKHIISFQNYGADIEARNLQGRTPLLSAVIDSKTQAVKALIQYGADMNAMDNDGETVISWAIYHNTPEVVQAICRTETKPSWTHSKGELSNVILESAWFGTIDTMNIIAKSDIAPVKCHFDEMRWVFRQQRSEFIFGKRLSPNKEFAAFENLLEKKGTLIINHNKKYS